MLISIIILNLILNFQLIQKIDPFPEIQGFNKNSEVEVFEQDNLFDYINGAADSYINYDFQKLFLQRYKGKNDKSIKIEVYRHSNQKTAFGIYSSERPSEFNKIDIGYEAYSEHGILNFYQENYYVKIFGYDIDESDKILTAAAEEVAERLENNGVKKDFFSQFPINGRIKNSEKYIHRNFLGYESLNEAFLAEYEIDQNYFELFLIEKEKRDECFNMLNNYFEAIKMEKAGVVEGMIEAEDPFIGSLIFIWADNLILGTVKFSDKDTASEQLKEFHNNIINKNLGQKKGN